MKFFLLKLLMRLSGDLAPRYVDKTDPHVMELWLEDLSRENSGYKHFYTKRKRAIQEGMVSGLTQEQFWMQHGRIAELQFINALSLELLKKKDKEDKKKK